MSIYFKPYSTYLIFFVVENSTDYGNPGIERPHVLAIDYQENAENQQINLLQSSRFGEALRIAQENLDARNFYAFNPEFDK